jgi:hypothetical protein
MIVYSAVVYSCLCPWVFYWIKEKSIFFRRRGNLQYEKDIPGGQDRLKARQEKQDGLYDNQDRQKEKQGELWDEQDRLEVQFL